MARTRNTLSVRSTAAIAAVGLAFFFDVAASAAEPETLSEADWASLTYTPFAAMQAVDANGAQTWTIPLLESSAYYPDYPQAYKLRGIVLNEPGKMLNGAPGPVGLGGSWQVYIQADGSTLDPGQPAELVGDFGGSALWMAQNYGLMHGGDTSYNYSNGEWLAEVQRVTYPVDRRTGLTVTEPLRPGDLVEVRARGALINKGKFNCNEGHTNEPIRDFQIFILDRDLSLAPASIILADDTQSPEITNDIMNPDGTFIFDATRQTGAEFYQAQYVTLENVQIVPGSTTWTTYGSVKVTDGSRQFDVKLGYNAAFAASALPSGTLDITGIFDQESSDPKSGYRMWATSPADFAPASALVPGDANADGVVNESDAARLAAHWNIATEASWFDGDFNGDRCVDAADASVLAANWGVVAPTEAAPAVPEPGTSLLLVLAVLPLVARRRGRRSGSARRRTQHSPEHSSGTA
jgi:hypothetical protein